MVPSMNLTTLSSYKCNHIVFVLCDWLIPLSIVSSNFPTGTHVRISFLLRLINFPLYGQTTFCLSIQPLMDTWVVAMLWTWAYNICSRPCLQFSWLYTQKQNCWVTCRRHKKLQFNSWVGKIPWRRAWQPTPVFFPGESPWTEEPGGLQSIGL